MEIAPYIPGSTYRPEGREVIFLGSNENALGPSPKACEVLRSKIPFVHKYPNPEMHPLREALATKHGLRSDQILCGNGSEELLHLVARAYVNTTHEVLMSEHSFSLYTIIAHSVGAKPVFVPAGENYMPDLEAFLARVNERTRMVFLDNPANPVGGYIPFEKIKQFHAALPENVILVLDGAYADYVEFDAYEDGIHLVEKFENVVVTRSFSKFYGLAGLRVGWGYFSKAMTDVLNRIRPPFNVTSLSQEAALHALEDEAFKDSVLKHNRETLAWTEKALQGLGLRVIPSVANFVLVEFSEDPQRNASRVFDSLLRAGIVVRPVSNHRLPNHLRITLGTQIEMTKLVEALARFLD